MLEKTMIMYIIFFFFTFLMLWRPKGLNETIPTSIGASLVLALGIVPYSDILAILEIISGASITIISTIIMTIVLESIGFFKWVAHNLVNKTKGSGRLLFLYIIVICFLMTLFFNNDGSILITTPIIIRVLNMIKLKPHQKIAYLLSGAIIATAASAPIAVSNISNLIALKIVGLELNSYVEMMFVPSMIGILTIAILLFLYFKQDIPKKIEYQNIPFDMNEKPIFQHPFSQTSTDKPEYDWTMFKICISIVVLIRVGFFSLTTFGIPLEWIAIVGAVLLIGIRWFRYQKGIRDIIKKTPWHILIFAFSMYVLVYGLKNVGFNTVLFEHLHSLVASSHLNAIAIMGTLLTFLSNIFNNLPAVMIGTLSLTEMNLDIDTLQVAYLANVIGSDIGALLTPVGTLATLLWMFILKKNKIPITWGQYFKVTIMVIPIGLIISLLSLYLWTNWLFF
ncbi:arsenic transporter [Virgibacillus ndiopensis]|uniref:arsenic transporter n=1 Tax=Virgibacillus ndiopensis TaxID=2004408 RepID=UPI000C084B2B|nr:arsenic transporter [Virgibacillus ndiopensis]